MKAVFIHDHYFVYNPQSGIDIEPNNSTAYLEDILITNTKAIGNKKRGFLIDLQKLNIKSKPVSITFKDCFAEGNMEGFSNRNFVGVQGNVVLENCKVKNSTLSGFTESYCLATSIKKTYRKCIAIDSYTHYKKENNNKYKSGFYISGKDSEKGIIGNSFFENCQSINTKTTDIDYGIVIDNGEKPFLNI